MPVFQLRMKSAKRSLPRVALRALGLCLITCALFAQLSIYGLGAMQNPLDPSFGDKGIVITPDRTGYFTALFGLTQDRRDRLIGVGRSDRSDFALLRYMRSGSLDSTFSADGFRKVDFGALSGAYSIAARRDDSFVVAGSSSGGARQGFALARIEPNGSLDPSWGRAGKLVTPVAFGGGIARDVGLMSGGRVVAAGVAFISGRRWVGAVTRYLPHGDLDRSFSSDGILRIGPKGPGFTDFADLALRSRGRLVLAGYRQGRFFLVRLLANGKLDRRFGGGDGSTITEVGRTPSCQCAVVDSMEVDAKGRYVVQGDVRARSRRAYLVLARYLPNGHLDRSFGRKGISRTSLKGVDGNEIAIQGDGRITVAAGLGARFAILRFRSDGHLDRSFAGDGVLARRIGNDSAAQAATTLGNGQVTVGGRTKTGPEAGYVIARLREPNP